MKHRTLSLILAALCLASVAACAGTPSAQPSPVPSSSSATAAASSAASGDAASASPADPSPSSGQTGTSDPTPSGRCAAWAGEYRLRETSPDAGGSLTLRDDCSVLQSDGTVYAMTAFTPDAAPKGTLANGETGDAAHAKGSYLLELQPTIHDTVNVYALFPAGVPMQFSDEDPADVRRDRLVSLSGGPYVNVPYDVMHDTILLREPSA